MTADRERESRSKMAENNGSYHSVLSFVCKFGIPGRSHQASAAVSHPTVIREGPFLGA